MCGRSPSRTLLAPISDRADRLAGTPPAARSAAAASTSSLASAQPVHAGGEERDNVSRRPRRPDGNADPAVGPSPSEPTRDCPDDPELRSDPSIAELRSVPSNSCASIGVGIGRNGFRIGFSRLQRRSR